MVTVVLSISAPIGLALVTMGLPPIVSTGAGAGDVATAPWSTGLPLNFAGSVAAGAGADAGAAMPLPLISRTWSRSSAFSFASFELLFSSASKRFITASRVGSAHAPDDIMAMLRAADATPSRYLFFIIAPISRTPGIGRQESPGRLAGRFPIDALGIMRWDAAIATRDNSGGGFAMKKRAGVLFLQHLFLRCSKSNVRAAETPARKDAIARLPQPFGRFARGTGRGALALFKNSTVANTSSLSPMFSRSCTLNSPLR